jgi:hypothetical protein
VATTVFIAVALAAATLFTTAQSPDPAAVEVTPGPVADDELAPVGNATAPPTPSAVTSSTMSPSKASGTTTAASASSGHRAAPIAARGSAPHVAPGTAAVVDPPAPRGLDVDVKVTELGGAPLPADAGTLPSSATTARAASTRIYSAADSGVSPAVLVKPHLPAEPPSDVPPWEVGTLELTVSTTGAVEQVRLISPYNRFQERMLVAAAKAWLFQPATKDGRTVRFRARIRVTL